MNTLFDNGTHKIESMGRLPNESEKAKAWRDSELLRTDQYVAVTDHPDYNAIMSYRQLLRDWPDESTFPQTKPVQ